MKVYCETCSGTGEGRHEGQACHVCRGSGTRPLSDAELAEREREREEREQLVEENKRRVELADTALACFKEMSETDPADALSDLLANLMHWAEAAKLDFDRELARAKFNYQCERVQ